MPPRYMTNATTPFAKAIRTKRIAEGLTQQELADLMGVSPTSISQYESGRTQPYPKFIETAAEALDMDPDELYALAGRVPEDLLHHLSGNLQAIRRTRQALGLPYTPTRTEETR